MTKILVVEDDHQIQQEAGACRKETALLARWRSFMHFELGTRTDYCRSSRPGSVT